MAPVRHLLKRFRRSQRGAELVEFALTFPLLLLIALGIVDFGFLFQEHEVLTNAAREGARVGALPDYSLADAENRAKDYVATSFFGGEEAKVTATATGGTVPIGGASMHTVTVTVTYPHEFLFIGGIASYFGGSFGTHTLTASSTMRTEAQAVAP
jgi:Flp pilus assembly protein TadG